MLRQVKSITLLLLFMRDLDPRQYKKCWCVAARNAKTDERRFLSITTSKLREKVYKTTKIGQK